MHRHRVPARLLGRMASTTETVTCELPNGLTVRVVTSTRPLEPSARTMRGRITGGDAPGPVDIEVEQPDDEPEVETVHTVSFAKDTTKLEFTTDAAGLDAVIRALNKGTRGYL